MARAASLLLLALALFALVLAADARAPRRLRGDSDPADKAVESEKDEDRALTIVSQEAGQVEFKSETNDNEFKFKADLSSNAPRMVVDWETGDDIDYMVEVRLYELIEFTDANGDGYSPTDAVARTVDYTAGGWGAYTTPNKDANGIWSFSISHAASGTEVVFRFAETDFTISGNAVPATGVKFDFKINNYQYAASGTDLALHARVKFSNDCDIDEFDGSDDALVVSNNATTAQVFFQWATTLDSPAGAAVTSSKPQGTSGSDNDVYFTFAVANQHNVNNIVWDPIYGVSGAASVAASVFAVLAALALLL